MWAVLRLCLEYVDDGSNGYEALSVKLDHQQRLFTTAFIREHYGIDARVRPRT